MAYYEHTGNAVSGKWCVYADVTTSETATTMTISVNAGFKSIGWGFNLTGVPCSLSVAGSSTSGSANVYTANGSTTKVQIASFAKTVSKAYGATSSNVSASINRSSASFYGGTSSLSVNVPVPAIVVTRPSAPSGAKVTRNSDTSATVSWSNGGTTTTTPRTGTYVDRQVDGGSWSLAATVGASTTSWSDTGTSANHRYAYRVYAYNSAGASDHSTTGAIVNTPAAPRSVTPARSSANAVKVTIDNSANITGTSIAIERSADKSAWTSVTTSGSTSYTDSSVGGGTWWYRARNVVGSLSSAWTVSASSVTTTQPPAAPTLRAPASSSVVSTAQASLTFSWVHNPLDGASQSKAEVAVSTDGGSTWSTSFVTTAQSLTKPNAWADGTTVTWRARTQGVASEGFGPWSGTSTFVVYSPPVVTITSPSSGATMVGYPFTVKASMSSASGSVTSATVDAKRGSTTATADIISGSATFRAASGALADGEDTLVTVSVTASTGLSASASLTVTSSFLAPAVPVVIVTGDDDAASRSVIVSAGDDGDLPATSELAVVRVTPEGSDTIADGLAPGAEVIDRIPPLDTQFAYRVYAMAESGATSFADVPLVVESGGRVFVNYGADLASRAVMWLDLDTPESGDRDVKTYDVVRPMRDGGVLPVAFFGSAVSRKSTIGGSVVNDAWDGADGFPGAERQSYAAWMDAVAWRGPVVLRLPRRPDRPVRTVAITGWSASMSAGKWHVPSLRVSYTEVDV